MSRMPSQFTTRRTFLGLPVGKPHTDWAEVRKAGMVGAGAVSTLAGGIRAWRVLPSSIKHLPGLVWGRTTGLAQGVVDAVPRPGGELIGRLGSNGRVGRAEKLAPRPSRRAAKPSGSGRKQPSGSTSKSSGAPSGARARRNGASRKTGATGKASASRTSR